MLYQSSKLHHDEQELIKKAPLLVSILIAGADGQIDSEEIEEVVKLIHIKAYAEASDMRHLYRELDQDAEKAFNEILKGLPTDPQEREKRISEELSGLNPIMEKLDGTLAIDFYKSLRSFAVFVAQATGGVLGMLKVNYHEKDLLKLPMLIEPSH